MAKSIIKTVVLLIISIGVAFLIYLSEENNCEIACIILSAIIGVSIEQFILSFPDLTDVNSWKREQRKYMKGHFICKDTLIRISFAYIFRIKVNGKYLLVMNSRHTGKYQPVGGVYKMKDSEKQFLAFKYNCMDDDMIPIDGSSRNDYRLRVKNRYLRPFVRRFNKEIGREVIDNISREFKEELIDTGILSIDKFKHLRYEYVGRYYNGVKFTQHFGCYELLLGDVVSLLLTPEQEVELQELLNDKNDNVAFFTDKQIEKLGVDIDQGDLGEIIADHSLNVLESSADQLEGGLKKGKIYSVDL